LALHTAVKPERILGCSDETVALVQSGRLFVDSVHHDETCGSDLPGGDRLS
jgi:hypothetical protein